MPQNKRTWILLRGLTRESGHWGPFLTQFQEQFADDRVVTLDLPGSGEFLNVKAPTTVRGLTKFMRKVAAERGYLGADTILVAYSLGAMVSLQWMTEHPTDFKAAVLVSGSVSGLSPFHRRLRWQVLPEALQLLTKKPGRERETAILNLVSNRKDKAAAIELWTDVAEKRPMSMANILRQLAAAASFKLPKAKPKHPVLVLVGDGDRWVDPSCSQNIADWLGAEIHRHPWAGHDIPIDDGEWLLKQITAWAGKV